MSASFGAGVGVFLGIQCGIDISGGHINPIISLLFLLRGDLKWWKFPLYILVQHVGAFCGAAVVYGVFKDYILAFEGETFMFWASYPKELTSVESAIVNQILAAGILSFSVAVLADPHNVPLPVGAIGPLVAVIVAGIGCIMTYPTTGILNPALDLAPRFFSWVVGYGDMVFSYNEWRWIWIPTLCPYAGCIIAVFLYYFLIGNHMPNACPAAVPERRDNSI